MKNNHDYEILTPDGWKDFSGVLTTNHKSYLLLEFDDGTELSCSLNHRIKSDDIFIEARHLKISDNVGDKKILWIDHIEENILLFDPVNVGDKHEYIGNGLVNHNCVEFLGSAGTLISSLALKSMAFTAAQKLLFDNKLAIYEMPKEGHPYVLVADSSHGKELDYSAFLIIDIAEIPYRVVGRFRDNNISAQAYPNAIVAAAKHYNNAYVLGENNDIGAMVLQILTQDLDYENTFYTEDIKGNQGLTFRGGKTPGLRTKKKTKRQVCNAIKTLIENQQIIVQDFETISEMTTFVIRQNGIYAADDDCNDDLMMCLVLFGWLTTQQAFKDLTDQDARRRLFDHQAQQMEEEMPPLAVHVLAQLGPEKIKSGGVIWDIVKRDEDMVDDKWSGYPDPNEGVGGW